MKTQNIYPVKSNIANKARSTNIEIRNKHEIINYKFEFVISLLEFISDFGFRISYLSAPHIIRTTKCRIVYLYCLCAGLGIWGLGLGTCLAQCTCTYTDTITKILYDARNCQQYPIEKIGNQWWMTENLNVGTQINSTAPGGQQQLNNGIIEKYCLNNNIAYCDTFGGLYEWGEAMGYAASDSGNPGTTQGVCPSGWRLPTDAEWCELENFIDPTTDPACNIIGGRGTDVGSKLKDNVSWNGTNTSGFSALPAGSRNSLNGSFDGPGSAEFFWLATEYNGSNSWVRYLTTGISQSWRSNYYKTYGFSMRCVKDIVSFAPLTISISSTNVNCNGGSDGTATVTASCGTAPYTYLWSNGATAPQVNNVPAGTYTVTVTDSTNSTATDSVTITEPAYIATYTDTAAKILYDARNCQQYPIEKIGTQWWMTENLNIGTQINSTAAGQQQFNNDTLEKYCYNNNPANCDTFGGLYEWGEAMGYAPTDNGNPGITQGVCPTGWRLPTDAEWCEMENFIDPTTDPGCDTTSWRGTDIGAKLKDNVAWNGNNASGFSALPAGYRDYSDGSFYVLGSDASFWSTTEYIGTNAWYRTLAMGNAQSGRGSVFKTFGFSVRCLQDISSICDTLTLSFTTLNATCAGDCDGAASALVTGGDAPYLWLVQNPDFIDTTYLGGDSIGGTDLCAGKYRVTVTDSNGCSVIDSVIITQPLALNIILSSKTNATCGTADGSATLTVNGGIPPYKYSWSSGDTLATADSLAAGIYIVMVTDANGCNDFRPVMINDVGGPSITGGAITNVSCYGGSDGAIDISVSGGAAPYTYQWSTGAVSEDISGLVAGPYEVHVTDANGCVAMESTTISQPDQIIVTDTVIQPPTCGLSDGIVAVVASGGVPPYSYLWSTGNTTDTVNNIGWGIFSVAVTDSNGCQKTVPVAVSNYLAPVVTIDSVIEGSCNNPSGSVYISVAGGTLPYIYNWSNGDTTEDITGLTSGNYALTLTDNAGCMAMASIELPSTVPLKPSICLVTVDSILNTNLIVWEKPDIQNVKSYNIYKESTQAGVYYKIGNVPVGSLSVFSDPLSDPQQQAWRYKISVVDSCDKESELGGMHKTIHLTLNKGLDNKINLIWDHYLGFYIPTYYIERYTPSTGWVEYDSISGNSISRTDNAPPPGAVSYRVVVKPPDVCTASKKADDYNSCRSNTSIAVTTGIDKFEAQSLKVKVYPNPGKGLFTVEMMNDEYKMMNAECRIFNMLGKKILTFIIHHSSSIIDLKDQPAGIYHLQIITDRGIANMKVVVE